MPDIIDVMDAEERALWGQVVITCLTAGHSDDSAIRKAHAVIVARRQGPPQPTRRDA